MRSKVIVVAFLAVATALLPSCTKSNGQDSDGTRPPKPQTNISPQVVVARGKKVTAGLSGTTVILPAGSAPDGARLAISPASAPQPSSQFPGDAVSIDLTSELLGPATIVMAYDPKVLKPGVEPMLYTWVAETSQWVPQAATVDPRAATLTASTSHLSTWTWGTPYYLWASVTGDRTTPPACSGNAPSWVKNFDHQDDPNAAVTSCIENADDKLRLKLRANRGIPILVEFTTPVTVVDGSIESKAITAETLKRWPNRVYIGARQELIVTFPNPNRVVAVSAKRWGGTAARFGLYAMTTFYEQTIGADGKINVLAQAANCLWDMKELVEGDDTSDIGPATSFLTSCIDNRLESFRASGYLSNVEFARLSQAFAYWKFADEFTKAVDTGFFDGDDDKYVYLSILTRKPAPAAVTEDELRNIALPSDTCDGLNLPPGDHRLVDGEYLLEDGLVATRGIRVGDVATGDLDADGSADGAMALMCFNGVADHFEMVYVVRASDRRLITGELTVARPDLDPFDPKVETLNDVDQVEIRDGQMIVTMRWLFMEDATCCATSYATGTYRLDGDKIRRTGLDVISDATRTDALARAITAGDRSKVDALLQGSETNYFDDIIDKGQSATSNGCRLYDTLSPRSCSIAIEGSDGFLIRWEGPDLREQRAWAEPIVE